jgi:hypothetical protein
MLRIEAEFGWPVDRQVRDQDWSAEFETYLTEGKK